MAAVMWEALGPAAQPLMFWSEKVSLYGGLSYGVFMVLREQVREHRKQDRRFGE